ncbi:hypothetical protein HXX76_002826 [Chlamydomonas incerta]|uniref:BTB domain-containing protein n=1 Tax=Chlamydomonas incerta TaxID=51695 RepID=A0A835TLF9_CHLIN|nr:hypothetical protein HXX76_002826 [Chlamydomonas incerta]|eukprot:KAG2442744.1 hypothetical protein HXX76_002826 [Chlamydomonas incerta]
MAVPIKEVQLDVENIGAVLTRSRPGGAPGETLVVTERGVQPLLGIASSGPSTEPLRAGTPLAMIDQTSGALTRAPLFAIAEGRGAAEPGVCVLATKDALLTFEPSGALKLLAGQPGNPGYADGVSGAAQVASAAVMTAGAHGDVWFSDGSRKHVRRASRQASGGSAAVTTMRWEVPDYTLVHSLAYDAAADALYVLTPRSVYRAAAPADPSSRLELVAGSEDASGCVDGGCGRAALFGSICDAAVDGAGRLLVLDMEGPGGGAVVRIVDPRADYAVSSVQPALGDLGGHAGRLDVLPSGELCVYEWGGNKLRLMSIPAPPKAAPPPTHAPHAAAAPPPPPAAPRESKEPSPEAASMRVLSEDWGAMLVTDPWNLYDVSIAVSGPRGDRTFGAHSLILLSRCEYLRFQITQQKAQGVTGKFSIPIDNADAEAFWLLLRHIYTGRVDFPAHMIEPVLELAERMLMARSADIIRTLLHHGGEQPQLPPQQQQVHAAAAPPAAAAAGAAAYGAASAPSAPMPPPSTAPPAEASAPSAPPPAAAAPSASAAGAQQPPPSTDLPYPLAPFQTPVGPPSGQQQQSGYGQNAAATSAPSPYGAAYGSYGAPAAAPAAAQSSPYAYGAATSATPYGYQSASPYAAPSTGTGAPSPYGAPPAASAQTPYGAQAAASAQTPYGAPPQAGAGQTPYGAASAAASQSPYGAPPAQTPYGAPPAASAQAPYGAPPAPSSQTPYGAPPAASAQTPYGAPPAASAQTPYGAPPAASAQTPYGVPSAASAQTPYGAPPAASAQTSYGAPPPASAQTPYGAPSAQTPYGAPQAASAQTPYGAPSAQTPYGAPSAQTPYGAPPPASNQTPYGQSPYGAPPAASAYTPYGAPPQQQQQQQQQPPAGYPPYGGGY